MLAELEGRHIQPIRAGIFYRIGLLLVAITMLILPVIYLGMVAAVAYLIYLHAIHDVSVFTDIGVRTAVIAYLGPLLIGLILLVFMLKPFFSRAGRDVSIPITLRTDEEPDLFQFIYRLCVAVGAPPPRRVDITMDMNASASFMSGWRGMLGKRLVLTFGLPLAGGLSAREFAGVLAHEMGHFSQGSAMRLTWVIRSINFWFARIVYQRNAWDAQLASASHGGHYLIQLVALIARGAIWLTRRILWCLMRFGHGVSAMMLRQMEFNADQFEQRMVGVDAFISTSQRLALLNVAADVGFRDLHNAWREQRLCDDLPALIESRNFDMPLHIREHVLEEHVSGKAGWFDSHPSDAARIAAARRENATGLFTVDTPARTLFRNFTELSRVATLVFYKQRIGPKFDPGQVVQTGSLVEVRNQQRKNNGSLGRYFRGLICSDRPVFPHLASAAMDPALRTERLLELRSQLLDAESSARAAAREFATADGRVQVLNAARDLRTAGIRKSGAHDPSIDGMSDDGISHAEQTARRERNATRKRIDQILGLAMERLALALAAERDQQEPRKASSAPVQADAIDFGEYDLAEPAPKTAGDAELAAVNAMSAAVACFDGLRPHALALRLLLTHVRSNTRDQKLIQALIWHSRKAAILLREAGTSLGRVSYPFGDDGRSMSLAKYLIRAQPPEDQIGQVTAAANDAVQAYDSLYDRLMGNLASRGERSSNQ